MSIEILKKELKDFFRSRLSVIYFILLFVIIVYSFYSAVDLYSKASINALNNPLYAAGFEPISGIFVPTFGGFFLILSLLLPFILVQFINKEKRYNTIVLISQFPIPLSKIYLTKLLAGILIVIISILSFLPLLYIWFSIGGHIPFNELLLLISGYFLYSLFIIGVSFFSISIFKTSAQASIFSLSIIVFSWFVDFGKEMNISSIIKHLSDFTVTFHLKRFEDSILSVQSIIYFILLFSLFSSIGYLFFDFSRKRKKQRLIALLIIHLILFIGTFGFDIRYDFSESHKNSFSKSKNDFLKEIPKLRIKVFLRPTDSRYKDYENDFLKKLKMVKSDIEIVFAKSDELSENYGIFEYELNGKKQRTYSNSEEEIFMILEELFGKKIREKDKESIYKGYPLVVKGNWYFLLYIIYILLLPFCVLFIYYRLNKIRR